MVIKIESYVGQYIRKIRDCRGCLLQALAKRSGLSTNAIRRIECGVTSPTVSSLHLLTRAPEVPTTEFFSGEQQWTTDFVQQIGRLRYEENGIIMDSLSADLHGQHMEPYRKGCQK